MSKTTTKNNTATKPARADFHLTIESRLLQAAKIKALMEKRRLGDVIAEGLDKYVLGRS